MMALPKPPVVNRQQEQADRLLSEAIAIYRAIGDRYSIAAKIGNYGLALLRAGKSEQAKPYLLQAAELFEEMGLEGSWRIMQRVIDKRRGRDEAAA